MTSEGFCSLGHTIFRLCRLSSGFAGYIACYVGFLKGNVGALKLFPTALNPQP